MDNLSPLFINITPKTSTYFPGQSLKFMYEITDILGNVFYYNLSHGSQLQLSGIGYSTIIEIDPNGDCPICDTGILINHISIKDNINELYTLNVAVMNNTFHPISPK